MQPRGYSSSDRSLRSPCPLQSTGHVAARTPTTKLSNEWILTAVLVSKPFPQPRSHQRSGPILHSHKNRNFNLILKIPASGATVTYLHFKKLFFIFFQSFDFLLGKRNYRFKLGIMVGLICVLGGGVMVLVGVLREKAWRGESVGLERGPHPALTSACHRHPYW